MPGETTRMGKSDTFPRTNNHRSATTIENSNRENMSATKRISSESPSGIYENGRFCHTACNLVGCIFRVETKEGRTFEGVLQAFSKDFEIALSLVHEIQQGCDDELPREGTVREKMIFSPDSVVTWTTIADLDAVTKSFATDGEISRFNGELQERKLEAWEPDAHGDDHIIAYDDDANGSGGWTAEEMFARNSSKYGLTTTYVDDLTLFSNVEIHLDETSPEYKLKYAEAERIARSIENNPASKKNAELENDDEERDILPRSSVSSFDSSTTATSNHADPSKYVPPNKRRGGGVQSDRGGGRTGRGGGPPTTPRGGDHRLGGSGPKTPRDEYGSGGNLAYYNNAGGGHRMGGGGGTGGGGGVSGQNYKQYPQPSQHLPHQQPSHIQHERSPGAAQSGGGNYANDWDRTRNQPRRDGPGGGGSGGYPSRQFSHDATAPSNRRDVDVGPNANRNRSNNVYNKNQRGDRGDITDLKNFRDNFNLVLQSSQHDSNRPHGPSANASSTTNQQQQSAPMQQQSSSSTMVVSPTTRQQTSPLTGPQAPQPQPPLPQRTFQRSPPRHQQQQQQQQNHAAASTQQQKSPDSNSSSTKSSVKNVGVSSPAQQSNLQQPPPPRMEQQRQQQQQHIQQASSYQHPQQSEQEYHQRPQPLTFDQRPPSVGSRGNAPPTPTDSEKSEPSVDIRKSKLNPEAKEFCPSTQFYRPTPVQTPAAGAYPVPVQSPQGIMQQPPPPMSPQQQQPPQIIYSQNMANAQYPPPSASNTITFMQGNGVPVYTINALSGQPTMAVLHTNGNYRPPRNKLAPQPAVAAATGQPIMTGPYPTQTPYFVQYAPAGVPTGQGHPPSAYQPQYVFGGAPRMQYIMQQQTNADGTQQPVYESYFSVVPQLVQVTANPYQQTTVVHQVPPPGSVPQQQQAQQQHPGAPTNVPPPAPQSLNNNNHSHSVAGHTQTPPAQQQQQQQQSNSNSGAISLQSYPPAAQTPQSPQYPIPPGGGYQMVVLPQGGGNYVPASHMYGSQNVALANAAAAAQAAAGGHHGHVPLPGHPSAAGFPTAQAHFVPADANAAAAYMQFPTITPYSQAPSAYPHLMRSSSVTGFMQQPVQSQGQAGVPQHSNMA